MNQQFTVKKGGLYWGRMNGAAGFCEPAIGLCYAYPLADALALGQRTGGAVVEVLPLGRWGSSEGRTVVGETVQQPCLLP